MSTFLGEQIRVAILCFRKLHALTKGMFKVFLLFNTFYFKIILFVTKYVQFYEFPNWKRRTTCCEMYYFLQNP